jgi:photosystem II stability/assembly factor-like uncharacterized protein
MANSVSADNIVNNVRGLQGFGSRYEYNPAQDSAAKWIIKELNWWGIPAVSQPYTISFGSFLDFAIVDENSMCMAAGACILRSGDGGRSWSVRSIQGTVNASTSIYAVDFPSPQIGWAVGTYGFIVKSLDGGYSWTTQVAAASYQFYDVKFIDQNRGLIVGANGTILRTSDGGVTWAPVNSGTQNSLWQIKVLDSMNVWTVGSYGTILHSSDGGQTWATQLSGTSSGLMAVEFINARHGWAVGSGSQILRTSNGGATWVLVKPKLERKDYSTSYFGVCFADSSHGWITDYTGGVLRTTDGGEHWQRTNPLNRYGWCPLRRITLLPNNYLVSCGSGKIVLSSDGGATWTSATWNLPSGWYHPTSNVVIRIPGTVTPENECVLVAHYDCASAGPGADDNASGTSAVMEAARILKDYKFESTISLVAVSAEELGMKGSEEYVALARNERRNIIGVVNADMIGFPIRNDTSRLVVLSYVSRNRLIDSVMTFNQRYGIGARMEAFLDSTGASDYSPFAMAGYDAVQLIEGTPQEIWGGLNPYYHTAHDSLNKLHPGYMRRAAQLMVATAAELARPIAKNTGSGIPASFRLEQNYPNPFNSGTVLKLKIPQSSHVILKIYDVLGREVTTLFEGDLDAGPYSFYWKPGNVSSGLYIYHMQAGTFVGSKKMILLK